MTKTSPDVENLHGSESPDRHVNGEVNHDEEIPSSETPRQSAVANYQSSPVQGPSAPEKSRQSDNQPNPAVFGGGNGSVHIVKPPVQNEQGVSLFSPETTWVEPRQTDAANHQSLQDQGPDMQRINRESHSQASIVESKNSDCVSNSLEHSKDTKQASEALTPMEHTEHVRYTTSVTLHGATEADIQISVAEIQQTFQDLAIDGTGSGISTVSLKLL